MKIEQAREVTSKALEHLSESLAQDESEGLRSYLAAIGKFHRYSMSNVLLIVTQRPDATLIRGRVGALSVDEYGALLHAFLPLSRTAGPYREGSSIPTNSSSRPRTSPARSTIA